MENSQRSPLVTVMVPTYAQAGKLAQAIQSALDQDLDSLEVLVLDDASPDATRDVVGGFADARLRYHRNERNIGRVANYRQGLYELARGKYVLNLDGDDWLVDPTYLRRAVHLLELHPRLALVFANAWRYIEETGEYQARPGQNEGLPEICSGSGIFLKYPTGEVWIPHLTALYRREVALDVGFYGEDVIGSDTESILRLIYGREIGFLSGNVAAWRVHAGNASADLDVAGRIRNLVCADAPFRHARSIDAAAGPALERWRASMLEKLCLDAIGLALESRNVGSATKFMGALAVTRPKTALRVFARGVRMTLDRSARAVGPTREHRIGHSGDYEMTEG